MRKGSTQKYWQTFLTFSSIILLWQILVPALKVPKWILPAPVEIFYSFFPLGNTIFKNAIITATIILGGFGAAIILGIPLALAISSSKFFNQTIYPLIVFSQLIPKIALGPLFVIWMGFDFKPRLLLTFLICFFPIVVNSILGFNSISQEVRYLSLSMGSRPLDSLVKIKIPSALPYIFSGLKLSAIQATIGAIVAEFVGASDGLGYLLLVAKGDLNTEFFFAVLLVLIAVGLIFYYIVEIAEKIAIPWHVSKRSMEAR